MLSPFEKNYSLFHIGYICRFDIGLYIKLKPSRWFRVCWGCPEADALWYDFGPFAFYRVGE